MKKTTTPHMTAYPTYPTTTMATLGFQVLQTTTEITNSVKKKQKNKLSKKYSGKSDNVPHEDYWSKSESI